MKMNTSFSGCRNRTSTRTALIKLMDKVFTELNQREADTREFFLLRNFSKKKLEFAGLSEACTYFHVNFRDRNQFSMQAVRNKFGINSVWCSPR